MKKVRLLITTVFIFALSILGYSDCNTTHSNGYCDEEQQANGGVKKTCVEKPTENSPGRCLFKKNDILPPGMG